jgi:hypothetical protein
MFPGNKWNISQKGPGIGNPGPSSSGAQGDTLGDAVATKSTGAVKACSWVSQNDPRQTPAIAERGKTLDKVIDFHVVQRGRTRCSASNFCA